MRDANIFVASSRQAIARSAPHIYLSALPFAPKDSLIYELFSSRCTGLISVETLGISRHGGRVFISLTGHTGLIHAVAYFTDGRLASGSTDGTVRIWSMRTADESMPHFASGDGDVYSVAVAPNDKSLVSGTRKGIVCIWDLEASREPPRRLLGRAGSVTKVAFSPRGHIIASVAYDGLRLWRAETGQQISVMSETAGIRVVAFSPDGRFMASLSCDKAARLWNTIVDIPTSVHVLDHKAAVFCRHRRCLRPIQRSQPHKAVERTKISYLKGLEKQCEQLK